MKIIISDEGTKPVKLIRCKDCKHWFYDECTDGYCEVTECFFWRADDFCSRGVAK